MTVKELVDAVDRGEPAYLPDVRRIFRSEDHLEIQAELTLPDGIHSHSFLLSVPRDVPDGPAETLVLRYLVAEIYNRLATIGGVELSIADPGGRIGALVEKALAELQIERPRATRTGYGRIVNMLDRMGSALHADFEGFRTRLVSADDLPAAETPMSLRAQSDESFREATLGLEGRAMCGVDIGGTDIKAVLAVDGRLIAFKEFDWNPAAYGDVEQIIDPLIAIVRLLGCKAELAAGSIHTPPELDEALKAALAPEGGMKEIGAALSMAAKEGVGSEPAFDAIGLCFPDVVVRNRIVGGEVPKTISMRGNAKRDFEEQFSLLTALNTTLGEHTRTGVVANTNDGPMAAFTAAVELAAQSGQASGVFAHTLGTDLGSGLVLANGEIPEMPLEIYNLILDLGSESARVLPPADIRSLANTNTGIAGTPQKLASQAAAFRFADELTREREPDVLARLEEAGFIVETDGQRIVPEKPRDLRKPYLARLMELAEENQSVAESFRRVGEVMAIVYEETEHMLDTGLLKRYLFGRFVKVPAVFELIQEGASRRSRSLELVPVNSDMAYTRLMQDLADSREYTVAQFGQAVGAVYLANQALRASV